MKMALLWIAETIAEKTGADIMDVLDDLETAGETIRKYFIISYLEEVRKDG